MGELYDRMRLRGIDMSWYDNSRTKKIDGDGLIPIDNETCSNLSIYFLKNDGSLWTITTDGVPYNKVRYGQKPIDHDIFICMHCKQQWRNAPIDNERIKHP